MLMGLLDVEFRILRNRNGHCSGSEIWWCMMRICADNEREWLICGYSVWLVFNGMGGKIDAFNKVDGKFWLKGCWCKLEK